MRCRVNFTIGHATQLLTEFILMLTADSQSSGNALIDW